MQAAHLIIVAIYLLCPVVVVVRVMATKHRYRRLSLLRKLRLSSLAGLAAGVLVCVSFAIAGHGRLLVTQVLIAWYFATSLIFLLQAADYWLWNFCKVVFRLREEPLPSLGYTFRAACALLMRAAIVFCVGLPYVVATMITYRPRAGSIDTPKSLFNWNYQQVSFKATDGQSLGGWWIPSPAQDATKTVLLCPGVSADLSLQLATVRNILPDGYNVLVVGFRAVGESSGQQISFGAKEKFDVLGAMRWLRTEHPSACRQVAGIGVSTGGAALLAAAADPSAEGQNIDAIAVFGTYDRLDRQVDTMVNQFVPQPLAWFVQRVGLPLAGVQVGADLKSFAPAQEIKQIWPRPVMVIHSIEDEVVPFEEGQALYDAALEPKSCYWVGRAGHVEAIKNAGAARAVKQLFLSAKRLL